jgi:hypothetical protein
MTAWVKKGHREEVGIIIDFVDPEYVIPAFYAEKVLQSSIQGHCAE